MVESLKRLSGETADSADVTDKHRSIKPRMNTNSHEWGNAENPIYNKLVSIRVYSWLMGYERSCIRVIREIRGRLFSGNWFPLVPAEP